MRTFVSNYCFYTNMIWLNFLSMGIVNTCTSFQSIGTGKYATPTRHLNFHFAPLVVSYKLPTVKSEFFLIEPNIILQFSSERLLLSYFRKESC